MQRSCTDDAFGERLLVNDVKVDLTAQQVPHGIRVCRSDGVEPLTRARSGHHLLTRVISLVGCMWQEIQPRRSDRVQHGHVAAMDTTAQQHAKAAHVVIVRPVRLIADVVTGKLDVRGVELPDLEGADIADDLGDSDFGSDTDQDDLPDAEEVEADDED